jgi:hypothetical protein
MTSLSARTALWIEARKIFVQAVLEFVEEHLELGVANFALAGNVRGINQSRAGGSERFERVVEQLRRVGAMPKQFARDADARATQAVRVQHSCVVRNELSRLSPVIGSRLS